jgi:hypothetical protein
MQAASLDNLLHLGSLSLKPPADITALIDQTMFSDDLIMHLLARCISDYMASPEIMPFDDVYIMSPLIMNKITANGTLHSALDPILIENCAHVAERWNLPLHNRRHIAVVCNVSQCHWVAYIITDPTGFEPVVAVYDSKNKIETESGHRANVEIIFTLLRACYDRMQIDYRWAHSTTAMPQSGHFCRALVPQQAKGSVLCGMHVVLYIDRFVSLTPLSRLQLSYDFTKRVKFKDITHEFVVNTLAYFLT